jgi:hypothetical protein
MPPLRLAIPAVAAAWALIFEIPRFVWVSRDPASSDFRLFYVSAQAGLQLGWPQMYDPYWLQQLSIAYVDSVPITPVYTYDFPPLLAWMVIPLTLLPLAVAFYVWTGINIASFTAASRLVFRDDTFRWLTVLLVSLAVWPTVFSLERGQPELIVYALAITSWWLATHGRDRWAGVVLGVAWAIKPQIVLLLPAIFLICGRPQAAAWWLLTTGVTWTVSLLVLGPTGRTTYLGALSWAASDPGFASAPLAAPFGPTLSLVVGTAVFAAITLAAAWRYRSSLQIAFAIGLVGTLASAVHLHEYDYVGLVVAAWLVLAAERFSVWELGWIGVGVVCGQLPAIGVRWPIVLFTPLWLVMLTLVRPPVSHERPAAAHIPRPRKSEAPAERPARG